MPATIHRVRDPRTFEVTSTRTSETRVYTHAVVYSDNYRARSWHSRRDLAERAAAEPGLIVVATERETKAPPKSKLPYGMRVYVRTAYPSQRPGRAQPYLDPYTDSERVAHDAVNAVWAAVRGAPVPKTVRKYGSEGALRAAVADAFSALSRDPGLTAALERIRELADAGEHVGAVITITVWDESGMSLVVTDDSVTLRAGVAP